MFNCSCAQRQLRSEHRAPSNTRNKSDYSECANSLRAYMRFHFQSLGEKCCNWNAINLFHFTSMLHMNPFIVRDRSVVRRPRLFEMARPKRKKKRKSTYWNRKPKSLTSCFEISRIIRTGTVIYSLADTIERIEINCFQTVRRTQLNSIEKPSQMNRCVCLKCHLIFFSFL